MKNNILTTDQKLEYLKSMKWRRTIDCMFDIPVLVLIYWLGYHTAFLILLLLFIFGGHASIKKTKILEEELGLEDYE